jgi:hypothetical protein
MRGSLRAAPTYPEQLSLAQEDWEEEDILEPRQRVPSIPKRKPEPAPEHFRIEIWRESKNDRKKVKFMKV